MRIVAGVLSLAGAINPFIFHDVFSASLCKYCSRNFQALADPSARAQQTTRRKSVIKTNAEARGLRAFWSTHAVIINPLAERTYDDFFFTRQSAGINFEFEQVPANVPAEY